MCKEATSMVLAVCCAVVLAEPPRVKRRKPLTANVGVVSVGLDTYWKQCPGLYDDMLKKANVFEKRVESHDVNVSAKPHTRAAKTESFFVLIMVCF